MTLEDQQHSSEPPKPPIDPDDLIGVYLKKVKDLTKATLDSFKRIISRCKQSGSVFKNILLPLLQIGLRKLPLILTILAPLFILFEIGNASIYTIIPGERGVVLRFGKLHKVSAPGLNFKFPIIDTVTKVGIDTVRKEEFGFRSQNSGGQKVFEKKGHEIEALMLTGDRNVIDVQWIVQYKASDPVAFLFNVRNIPQAVRDASEMSIRRIVGNMDFDYILSNRKSLAAQTQKEVQAALDNYHSGITIITVQLQDVNPPDAVKPAFNEVNEADQDMVRLVNEAQESYNQQIPKAKGTAKKIIQEAQGYAAERVDIAEGATTRFLDVLREYRKAKDVTRRRMYLETMQAILPTVTNIYVIDKETRSLVPLLNLNDRSLQQDIDQAKIPKEDNRK